MHVRTEPDTQGLPLRYQVGSGRTASPRTARTSSLSRNSLSTRRIAELERRSRLAA
jgi:hypothetical protein